jgi:hypothetical protein
MADETQLGEAKLGTDKLGIRADADPSLVARYTGEPLTTEEKLASRLPIYYPKDPGSGNYFLLAPIAAGLDDLDDDHAEVGQATHVQTADTIPQLWRLAELVNLPPRQGETVEHYKARVIARFQLVTTEGTINDLLHAASVILNIRKESIGYDEPAAGSSEIGTASLQLPAGALSESTLTTTEVATILNELMPASYRLSALTAGTFTFISPEDYNAGLSDAALGFDGLDVNGDPKGNGGTYAGVLR